MATTTAAQGQSGAPYNAVVPKAVQWGPLNLIQSSGIAGNLSQEHQDWLLLIGEFVFVLVLAYIAGNSPTASKVIVAFLLGLWLLWLTLGDGSGIINGALKAMGLPTYNPAGAAVGNVVSGVK